MIFARSTLVIRFEGGIKGFLCFLSAVLSLRKYRAVFGSGKLIEPLMFPIGALGRLNKFSVRWARGQKIRGPTLFCVFAKRAISVRNASAWSPISGFSTIIFAGIRICDRSRVRPLAPRRKGHAEEVCLPAIHDFDARKHLDSGCAD